MNVALLDLSDYWFHPPQNYDYENFRFKFPVNLMYLRKYYEMQLSHASWQYDPNNWFSKTTLVALVRMAASQQFLLNQNTNC